MLRTTESLYDQGSNCCLSAGASCVCSKYQIILLLSFDIFAPISMQSPFGMSHLDDINDDLSKLEGKYLCSFAMKMLHKSYRVYNGKMRENSPSDFVFEIKT